MVRQCYLCKVYNYQVQSLDLSFHRFPSNPQKRNIWISALEFKEGHQFPKQVEICSNHFQQSDFEYRADGTKYLKPHAVPLRTHSLDNPVESTRFPRDMDAKLEWCAALRIDPDILTETSTICCDHFSPSDLLGQPGQRRALRRNAIPLTNLKPLTELDFLTVVEDVDDSRVSSPEVQEFPQESVSIKSPIKLPTANAKNGLSNNSNVPANIPVVSQLVLVPAGFAGPTAFIQNVPASIGQSSVILVPQTVPIANPFLQNPLLVSKNESPQIDSSKSPCEKNLVNGHSTTSDPKANEELECSSSTLTASEVGDEIETSVPFEQAKKKRLIRYFGDISSDDMDSPPRARMCLNVARRTVCNLKTKLKQLRNQNRLLKQRVESMKKLYSYLEENNYLNQYARAAIKAVLPEEADSFLRSQHQQTKSEIQ